MTLRFDLEFASNSTNYPTMFPDSLFILEIRCS